MERQPGSYIATEAGTVEPNLADETMAALQPLADKPKISAKKPTEVKDHE